MRQFWQECGLNNTGDVRRLLTSAVLFVLVTLTGGAQAQFSDNDYGGLRTTCLGLDGKVAMSACQAALRINSNDSHVARRLQVLEPGSNAHVLPVALTTPMAPLPVKTTVAKTSAPPEQVNRTLEQATQDTSAIDRPDAGSETVVERNDGSILPASEQHIADTTKREQTAQRVATRTVVIHSKEAVSRSLNGKNRPLHNDTAWPTDLSLAMSVRKNNHATQLADYEDQSTGYAVDIHVLGAASDTIDVATSGASPIANSIAPLMTNPEPLIQLNTVTTLPVPIVSRDTIHGTELNVDTFDVIGILGFVMYVLPYLLLQLGWLSSKSLTYSVMNMAAASLVLISLMDQFNLSSALIQVTWIVISAIGFIRIVVLHLRAKTLAKVTRKAWRFPSHTPSEQAQAA